MIQDPPETYILWHCAGLGSSEYASLIARDDGYRLEGLTVMPFEDRPCYIEYAVAVDAAWSPHFGSATITTPTQITTRQLEGSADGHWRLDGEVAAWRYQSGHYDFHLTNDVASGLVLEYGDDLWRAVARSTRSDATAR